MSKIVQLRLRWVSAVTPLTNVKVRRLTNVEVSDEEANLMLVRDKGRFFKEVSGKADMSLVEAKKVDKPAVVAAPENPLEDTKTEDTKTVEDEPKKRGRKKKVAPSNE